MWVRQTRVAMETTISQRSTIFVPTSETVLHKARITFITSAVIFFYFQNYFQTNLGSHTKCTT